MGHYADRADVTRFLFRIGYDGLIMKTAPEKPQETGSTCERFLQTLTVSLYMLFLVTGSVLGWLIWLLIIYFSPSLRIPMLIYGAWIYYDRESAETGFRRNESMRKWKIWKYHRDYFPAKLIKTAELTPEKNYIFCSFPHGILATATYSAFGNHYGEFEKLFPGLKPWMLTLIQHFHTPFLREYALSIGALPASASCMNRMLNSNHKGNALVLLVGGAQETFYSEPGTYTVNLSHRKGFIKIALKNGASLVPVMSFGEPDIYCQVRFKEGSFCHSLQMLIKKITNIAPVMFYGRFSVTPFRKPLNTVVGEPIHLEKVDEPTKEEVDEVHRKFVDKLKELFQNEKHKYVENADEVNLRII